ncbi:MAG: anti-sigma factor domain-containing protein [Xanthobacteraceae bacterium]
MTDDLDHDERDALAAEYALGTLDAEELAQAEALRAADASFAAQVLSWERRLGSLNAMVEDVEPSPDLWEQIRARISGTQPSAPMRLPEVERPSPGLAERGVILLSRRLTRWRGAAVASGALAALLALFVAVSEFAPQRLPGSLAPRTRQVAAAPSGRFVAVLQKDASAPAFLLTVDIDHRSLTVRRVAAGEEPGKSYELWLVSDRLPAPRSLGLVGTGEFTQKPLLASYDKETIDNATYAVSLEPEGGSPTGVPTGPVLYLGKLVEATPPGPARNP